MFDAPLKSSIIRIKPEWLDYNGHMNMAYYNVLFDLGVDEGMDLVGLGPAYVQSSNCSFFTAEVHVCYVQELHLDQPVYSTLHLLDFDDKRVHFFQELYHAEEGFLSATSEQMSLHVNMAAKKVSPWSLDIYEKLAAMKKAHEHLEKNSRIGRVMQIPKK